MNTFQIKTTEFGVEKIDFSIKNNELYLEIMGSEKIFDQLSENEDGEWSWALYPPKFYVWGAPYGEQEIAIKGHCDDSFDCALYLMEHNDFIGTLHVTDEEFHVCGVADISGNPYEVKITVART